MTEGLIDGQVYQYTNTEGQDIKFFKEGSFVYFDTDGDPNDPLALDIVILYSDSADEDGDGYGNQNEIDSMFNGGVAIDPLGRTKDIEVRQEGWNYKNIIDFEDNFKNIQLDYDDINKEDEWIPTIQSLFNSLNMDLEGNGSDLYSTYWFLNMVESTNSLPADTIGSWREMLDNIHNQVIVGNEVFKGSVENLGKVSTSIEGSEKNYFNTVLFLKLLESFENTAQDSTKPSIIVPKIKNRMPIPE